MASRPAISGQWGGHRAPLAVVSPTHDDDEAHEPALVRAARLLEAQVALTASVEREAALVRAVVDARLARIEAILLAGTEATRRPVSTEGEHELVQIVRRRRVQEACCERCGATFTRRHPRKTRCDACTRAFLRENERARYARRKEAV